MPNYLKLMRSIKEPPNRHYHWSRYDDPKTIQARKLDGYDFVTGKEIMEAAPKKKGRFDPGNVYVNEEGLVRLGDMVLMQTSKENWTKRKAERAQAALDRKKYFRDGGELAGNPHKTHSRLRTSVSKHTPMDGASAEGEN